VPDTNLKSCVLKNATPQRLNALIAHNLASLEHTIDYNVRNGIRLFRISSDLIPFGSSAASSLNWESAFSDRLSSIAEKIAASGMRVSMHPGQYTVLNSPNASVVARARDDLSYHARVLDALAPERRHKIILHIGGMYGNANSALNRFASEFRNLDESVRRRLVLENDGKIYTISDVLELSTRIGTPVVYDNLHNALKTADPEKCDAYWIAQCTPTWRDRDGTQKVHYSQQHPQKIRGAHSDTIEIDAFLDFYHGLPDKKPDIMLEVKDKNLSALKCILCTSPPSLAALESEWARYKYAVLERSPAAYQNIRSLLRDKPAARPVAFYRMIERALETEPTTGRAVAAAEHVWGYFKHSATPAEARRFMQKRGLFQRGKIPLRQLKAELNRLSGKYQVNYLLNSYYFSF
jgi:UV DNA damage endonuclease